MTHKVDGRHRHRKTFPTRNLGSREISHDTHTKVVMSRTGPTMVAKGKLFLRLCLPDDSYRGFYRNPAIECGDSIIPACPESFFEFDTLRSLIPGKRG